MRARRTVPEIFVGLTLAGHVAVFLTILALAFRGSH